MLSVLHRQFGAKALGAGSVKAILKALPETFSHSDASVRAEASALAVELHRWLGAVVRQQLSELRPAQLKEIDEGIARLPAEPARPERYLRSQIPSPQVVCTCT